ncbi:hypothetical protein LMJ53_08975 [Rheinheimera sp. UJ51]|uniref:hypothetical protein n=1 Tax=Rheinheimera sp. UJ51 TaxID=2892446 RepID=UPI001E2FFA8E|nr:hypothetical protein [Rheinheimera sp. UJ51]MCC5451854.1 hypothetical protein [Rheinheimera sp. UJ51]
MQNLIDQRSLFRLLFSIFVLLMFPFLAMQVTAEVYWSLTDFILAAALLFVFGFTILVIRRKVTGRRTRLSLLLLCVALFCLVWAQLAVGLF